MIDANQAYNILSVNHPASIVKTCLDFGSFFAFSLAPFYIGSETYYTGTTLDAVDKKTGKIFEYDILSDLDAYEKAKEIDVKTMYDQKI